MWLTNRQERMKNKHGWQHYSLCIADISVIYWSDHNRLECGGLPCEQWYQLQTLRRYMVLPPNTLWVVAIVAWCVSAQNSSSLMHRPAIEQHKTSDHLTQTHSNDASVVTIRNRNREVEKKETGKICVKQVKSPLHCRIAVAAICQMISHTTKILLPISYYRHILSKLSTTHLSQIKESVSAKPVCWWQMAQHSSWDSEQWTDTEEAAAVSWTFLPLSSQMTRH